MDDHVYHETEKILKKVSTTRNRYINEAIAFYNLLQQRKILKNKLMTESKAVREESMLVLAEFEKLGDED